MDCLDTIIGLSKSECECLPDKGGVDSTTSDTGIYLDTELSLKGLNQTDCDQPNNVWQILEDAREEATTQTLIDLNIGISQIFDKRRGYDGWLGKEKTSANVPTTETYSGFKITCKGLSGSFIKIRDIQTKFTTTEASNLVIYNNISDIPLYTITVNSVDGVWTSNDVEIRLPLWSDEDSLEYYFLHTKQGYVNETSCGCGNKKTVSQFLNIDGIRGDSLLLDDLDGYVSKDNMHGLRFQSSVECDIDLCNLDKDIKTGLASAIAYKGKQIVIKEIYKAGKINAYTMIQAEALAPIMDEYAKNYNHWIDWLSNEVPKGDCYTCDSGMRRTVNLL